MAILAYQVTNGAYQGIGQFAYQGSADVAATVQGGGGYNPSQGYSGYETRRRSPDEVRREREELGIIPRRIIEDVAIRQVERLEVDQQKQFDELSRELQIQGIEFDRRYLEALNSYREILLSEEIGRRLRMKIDDEAMMMMLVLIAAAA